MSSLDNNLKTTSAIVNGYIEMFHPRNNVLSSIQSNQSNAVHPDPAKTLPECVVIGYRRSSGGGLATYINLGRFFQESGDPYNGQYSPDYNGYSSGGGVGGGGGGRGEGGSPVIENDEIIELEPDELVSQDAQDIRKIFNCFDKLPTSGAKYTFKLCSDLPVNSNPIYSVDGPSGISAGHTFVVISKSVGTSTITQSFGFYPTSMSSALLPFNNASGVIKFNSNSEINASIESDMNEMQFQSVKVNAIAWAGKTYNITNYNCTDYAVDLFDLVRSTPLDVPAYTVTLTVTNPYNPISATTVDIKRSPQMLFSAIENLKANRDINNKIRIDKTHNYRSAVSHGICD